MSRRTVEQIMRDRAVPTYHDQATLVRSLARVTAAVGRAGWYRRNHADDPAGLARVELEIAKDHAKMVRLTRYLTAYGRTWEQRLASGLVTKTGIETHTGGGA